MISCNVLIIGAGAIGAFYGALLAKAGAKVSVLGRSDSELVRQHGFDINSRSLGDWHFTPNAVLPNAGDLNPPYDYVLLCTKVLPTLDRVALLRPAITDDTAIVFIQNGVDIEQEIHDAYPDNDVISGLAFICCNRASPVEINHLAYGRLTLGAIPGGVSAKTAKLCQLFQDAGIACTASENIVTERWKKCVWNAPFNPLSVLSGGLSTLDMLQCQQGLISNIMRDVVNIAEASGHKLPETIIDACIESTYKMPPYKTSMLLDYEKGNRMEIEAILGNALRRGQQAKLAMPYLESVYGLMKLRELKP